MLAVVARRLTGVFDDLRLSLRSERARLVGVLAAGLLHGLLYVFVVPPWQHYEEPAHFEYAWMIFTRRSIPGFGTFDNDIRRLIAESMIAHDFYRGMDYVPDLTRTDQPIDIGLGQADTAPLFHIVMTVPLGLFAPAGVEAQLYAARLTSLALFLLTLWVAYRLVGELTPAGHPLRWLVPAGMALLPALVDIMTAVNDDVGAVAVFSAFLWAGTRLLMRGVSTPRVAALLSFAALCAVAKTTTLIALALAPLAIVLAVWRRWRWTWGAVGAFVCAAGFLAVFGWGEAAGWYPRGRVGDPARAAIPSPVGRHALTLAKPGLELWQPIPSPDLAALRGQTVTLGAWVWASVPGSVVLPMVGDGQHWLSQSAVVGTQPGFYRFETVVPAAWTKAYVRLVGVPMGDGPGRVAVYYDGLTLLAGSWPTETPLFYDANAAAGEWAGRPFANAVRNASAEASTLRLRSWVSRAFQAITGDYLAPATLLAAFLDWRPQRWLYAATTSWLFSSFWARFGWAHVSVPAGWYLYAAGLTVAGLLGAIVALGRAVPCQSVSWRRALLWLAAAALLSWGTVFLRGLFTVLDAVVLLPVARYAFPVIIPTLLVLMAGWLQGLGRARASWILAAFLVLDAVSLLSIYRFYQGG
jgi:hypothetical protein